MRFVNRSYQEEDTPSHLRDVLEIIDFDRILAGDKSGIKSEIYRGDKSPQKTSKALATYYENKCAYCENNEYEPQVEHYRPTGKSKQDGGHEGYPWLCYEWSNLLPSCHDCNRRGAKGTRFPILGIRVAQYPLTADGSPDTYAFKANHTLMLAEQPILLHPEIDDPRQFFRFDSEGKIFGTDNAGRGEKTSEICRLYRQNLCVARQRIVDDVLNRVRNHLLLFERDHLDEQGLSVALEQIFIEMKEKANDIEESFTLFRWYFFEHFPDLFPEGFHQKFPTIENTFLQAILNFYSDFRQSQP